MDLEVPQRSGGVRAVVSVCAAVQGEAHVEQGGLYGAEALALAAGAEDLGP